MLIHSATQPDYASRLLNDRVSGQLDRIAFVGAAVAALGTLYLFGLWVDHSAHARLSAHRNVCSWHKADIAAAAFRGKADIGSKRVNVCFLSSRRKQLIASNCLFQSDNSHTALKIASLADTHASRSNTFG
jgi:hypothetical protein